MEAPSIEKAVDVLPGAERPAKARITRSDGSTIIGHMEVCLNPTTLPPPPPLPPLFPPTVAAWGIQSCQHTVAATAATANGVYALLLRLRGVTYGGALGQCI